jgi:hypothetical protein
LAGAAENILLLSLACQIPMNPTTTWPKCLYAYVISCVLRDLL